MANDDQQVITITPDALVQVLALRAEESDGDFLGLWLEVSGVAGTDFTYDMYFVQLDEQREDDNLERHGDLPVVVPASSVDRVRGAMLDVDAEQLVLVNPNRPSSPMAAGGDGATAGSFGSLEGDTAEKILTVLEQQVNPAIASHGGHAELIGVEGETAFLKLSGGCQGCGMAAATLRQGIEVAIRDAVPEILELVDVTDHAGGENPYY